MIDIEHVGVPAFSLSVEADGTFRYTAVNRLNFARTGLIADAIVGKTPHDLFEPAAADRLCEHYRACVATRSLVDYEVSVQFPNGISCWRASLVPIIGAGGTVERMIGLCHEVPSEGRLSIALRATNKHLDLAIRCLKGADWRFDVRSGRYDASDNLALLMGEARPRPVPWTEWAARILAEDLVGASCDILLSGAATEQVVRFRFRDSRDEIRWAQCRRLAAAEDAGTPFICGVIVDVTDERQREMKLESEAERDSLTGLLNRRGFQRDMDRALAAAGIAARPLAIFMLDLDGFKSINDRFGHSAGDEVLIEVARRLTTGLGERAVVARLGGDEFVIACAGMEQGEASAVRHWLVEALGYPFRHKDHVIGMGSSIGLAWRGCDPDLNAMIAEADERLYANKRSRKAGALAKANEPLDQMSLFAA